MPDAGKKGAVHYFYDFLQKCIIRKQSEVFLCRKDCFFRKTGVLKNMHMKTYKDLPGGFRRYFCRKLFFANTDKTVQHCLKSINGGGKNNWMTYCV